ncbi:hypothetical protein ACFLRN_02850 [Thermoproteota archaeon]
MEESKTKPEGSVSDNLENRTNQPKSFSTVSKNKLSDFAKAIIRECAEQTHFSVYGTFAEVKRYCPKTLYTIEEVGKYLRYVKRAIIRKQTVSPPLHPPTQNLPHVTDSLTPPTLPFSKNQKIKLNVGGSV